MDEYVMTVLAENHRRELLREAENEALARQIRAGREPWWRRLVRRSAAAPTDRPSTLDGALTAPVLSTR